MPGDSDSKDRLIGLPGLRGGQTVPEFIAPRQWVGRWDGGGGGGPSMGGWGSLHHHWAGSEFVPKAPMLPWDSWCAEGGGSGEEPGLNGRGILPAGPELMAWTGGGEAGSKGGSAEIKALLWKGREGRGHSGRAPLGRWGGPDDLKEPMDMRHPMEARAVYLPPTHPQCLSHLWSFFSPRSLFIQTCSFLLIYIAYT